MNNLDEVFETLKIFFADIPNIITLKNEKYYQSIFYVIFKILNLNIDVEINTNIGRIDAVVKTKTHIYIIEFKLGSSANMALKQIREKKYYEKYLDDEREKLLVGVSFSAKKRNIVRYIVEEI